MTRKIIQIGFTNISYIEDGKFIQEKKYNGFNHGINYEILKEFNFVPRLLKNTREVSEWEYIEGEEPSMTDENLFKIAECLRKLHSSKLKFPKNNIKERVAKYREIITNKQGGIKIKALNDFAQLIDEIVKNMKINTPLHNDLWPRNMVINKDKKIYICDWEYATMGDINFELAYFIESANLSIKQEETFLDAYKNYDELDLLKYKILVNYLVILWVYSQEKVVFSTTQYENKLYKLNKLFNNYKQ